MKTLLKLRDEKPLDPDGGALIIRSGVIPPHFTKNKGLYLIRNGTCPTFKIKSLAWVVLSIIIRKHLNLSV
jgi:hypothetical protein